MIDFWLYCKYLYLEFSNYSLIVRTTLYMVTLLSVIYLFSIINILREYRRLQKKEKRWKTLKRKHYEDIQKIMYASYALDEEEVNSILKTDIINIKKKWEKRIWTKMLFKARDFADEEVSKTTMERNFGMITEILGIKDFWIKESSSTRSFLRKKNALRRLNELSSTLPGGGILAPFLYHKNNDIRRFARNEYMRIEKDTPFNFLEEGFDNHFNKMDEIRIHTALKEKAEKGRLPLLITFINNKTSLTFRCFLFKQIAFFNQFDAAPYLENMFKKSKDRTERSVLVETIGALRYKQALHTFFNEYDACSSLVKTSIIKAIGMIGCKDALIFLRSKYELSSNIKEKILIKETIDKCRCR